MNRRQFLAKAAPAALAAKLPATLPRSAQAQQASLRLHQFLPPVATVPFRILKP